MRYRIQIVPAEELQGVLNALPESRHVRQVYQQPTGTFVRVAG